MFSVMRTMTDGRHIGTIWRSDDTQRGAALDAHGGDVVGVADRQRLRPGQPGDGRPGRQRDGDDRVAYAGPECRDEAQRQDQAGERQEDVVDPHQHRIHPAAEIPGRGADQQADRCHDHGDQGCDHQRDAGAVGQAGIGCRGPGRPCRTGACGWAAAAGRQVLLVVAALARSPAPGRRRRPAQHRIAASATMAVGLPRSRRQP